MLAGLVITLSNDCLKNQSDWNVTIAPIPFFPRRSVKDARNLFRLNKQVNHRISGEQPNRRSHRGCNHLTSRAEVRGKQ
jgi:hypothetical protein